jgi:hypothetical protein
MARTYRTSRLAAAGVLPEGRIVKESRLRRLIKPLKRINHHRARRAITHWLRGELMEAL